MTRMAIFAFNGDPMCFGHALLNLLDMRDRGYDAKLIIEGTATKQVVELLDKRRPFADLYEKAKEEGLIDCVCQACSSNTGSLESAREQGLPLCKEMNGHPSVAKYIENGYQVLIF